MSDDNGKVEWRDIPGHEGSYQVSNTGIVRSLDRTNEAGNQISGKVLKPGRNHKGYLLVVLCKHRKCKSYRVHQLVLQAFVSSCPRGAQVNHRNGDIEDNSLENLEYVTSRQNFYHQVDVLKSHYKAKLNLPKANKIRRQYASGRYTYDGLAAVYGVHPSTIRRIVTERIWKDTPVSIWDDDVH